MLPYPAMTHGLFKSNRYPKCLDLEPTDSRPFTMYIIYINTHNPVKHRNAEKMGLGTSKSPFRLYTEQTCHGLERWDYIVRSTQSVDDWKLLQQELFEDGIYHRGRLEILDVYTTEVINHLRSQERYEISTLIEGAYREFKRIVVKHHLFENMDAAIHHLIKERNAMEQKYILAKDQVEQYKKTQLCQCQQMSPD